MRRPPENAKQLLDRTLSTEYFQGRRPAIPYTWAPARASNPLVVVVGENGGGKSFVRRICHEICGYHKIECMPISMEGRQSMMFASLIYGSEAYRSTGQNSIHTVRMGIKTSQGRANQHVIIWDEPDIGLSEGAAASVGKAIADFVEEVPDKLIASIVTTHRKSLVRELARWKPHYLFVGGEGPASLQEWLEAAPVVRTLDEIEAACKTRFDAIQAILNKNKPRRRR